MKSKGKKVDEKEKERILCKKEKYRTKQNE